MLILERVGGGGDGSRGWCSDVLAGRWVEDMESESERKSSWSSAGWTRRSSHTERRCSLGS
jgi:hypothetical protein